MSLDDILDEVGLNEEQQLLNTKRRQRYAYWAWRSFFIFLFFLAAPSLIMYNYSPGEVNKLSPIDAHVLVFGLFAISGIAFLGFIVLLFLRYFVPKK
jgi:polyferredoxin